MLFRSDGLDTDIVGAGCYCTLDLCLQQRLECGEQRVLQVDGERQQPVEELADRRQLLLERAVAVGEREDPWRPRSA